MRFVAIMVAVVIASGLQMVATAPSAAARCVGSNPVRSQLFYHGTVVAWETAIGDTCDGNATYTTRLEGRPGWSVTAFYIQASPGRTQIYESTVMSTQGGKPNQWTFSTGPSRMSEVLCATSTRTKQRYCGWGTRIVAVGANPNWLKLPYGTNYGY